MNTSGRDLNLLVVFRALMHERSVSAASRRLGLSQPAVSHALGRLRREFGDELLVRAGRGMTPTPMALRLFPAIDASLRALEDSWSDPGHFDPLKADLRFVIAATDYFETLVLPTLVPKLCREAPNVTLVCRPLAGRLPIEPLEQGSVDLAVGGFFGELPPGAYARDLWDDDYACLLRADHPAQREGLDLATYLSLDHVLVSLHGDLHGVVDRALAAQGLTRRVTAGVSGFHTPAAIVRHSDCVVTLPSRIARALARSEGLCVLPVPLEVEGFTLRAVWHARTHDSRAHRWIREQIAASEPGV